MSIYVEVLVRAPMDALWSHTQTPALHERWDLRFSRIEYVPRNDESEPQRFQYTTRIGFGLEVSGEGETVGRRDSNDGSSTSALKFGSDEPLSIVREGSGYWKYIPTDDAVRFLTWYDYRTRFGAVGAYFDRLIFRRLIGWATAWSFDRLRLWLEQDVAPEQAIRQWLIHTISRVALAAVFIYHGLIPKLLTRNVDEIAMVRDAGLAAGVAGSVVTALGILELSFAVALLVAWRRRWPLFVCLALVLLATAGVAMNSPRYFSAAFNPFTLNLAIACFASIDLLVVGTIPSAARCLRRPVSGEGMKSIYERVLGADFHRLHPQIQCRFGFSSSDRIASIGTGVMDEIWKGRFYTEPFLRVGTWRRIMFPETGRNIPFTIENYAFVDQFGRETVSWIRTFESRRTRRFDAYMVYSDSRRRIVDYLGSHEHLAVDIDLSVDEAGGLRLRSGAQRFYEGVIGFSFPMLFSGIADVREWYDDAAGCFRIVVDVNNSVWGPLFGYRGCFNVEWRTVSEVPRHILPKRQERRD